MQTPRYFASGPEGHFWCDDPGLANRLVDAIDKDGDWTITDLHNPVAAEGVSA